ncbi:MAG TPA: hypothetical protein VFK06_11920 [Candidatus Angelobacter sp.]|nr:hypothetical protein [Candidatus Angelobacter sp.]
MPRNSFTPDLLVRIVAAHCETPAVLSPAWGHVSINLYFVKKRRGIWSGFAARFFVGGFAPKPPPTFIVLPATSINGHMET